MKKNNLQEHHKETFGNDESYDTIVKFENTILNPCFIRLKVLYL